MLVTVLNWNCVEKSNSKNGDKAEINKDSISEYDDSDLTVYDKKWVNYVDEKGVKQSEMELYISKYGDTLSWSKRIFKNGVLDSTQSTFYNFEAKRAKDSVIKGRITMFSSLDYSVKEPIIQRKLTVDFINYYLDKKKVISFESKNQNYVDFEFKNNDDEIVGLLTEERQINLQTSPDSIQFIWSKLPIDNQSPTDNPFIHVHELNKNKR